MEPPQQHSGRPGAPREPGDSDHPDLTGLAGDMRAEWRAEQDAAAVDAAEQWRHGRTLVDWLRDRMHAGDRLAVTVVAQPFVGIVDEVGDDLFALRGAFGRVEIHVTDAIPLTIEVVEHATAGGRRAPENRTFRAALLAREGQSGVTLGSRLEPAGIEGTILVGADYVSVVGRGNVETVMLIAHVGWIAPAPA